MEDNQRSILDDLAGILDAEGEKLQSEAAADRDKMLSNIRVYFKMSERQSNLVLTSVAGQVHAAAMNAGTTPADFLRSMTFYGRIAMFAFTAGCVHQHDLDHLLDPITGERLQ